MNLPTMTLYSTAYREARENPTRENLPVRLREGDDLGPRIEAANEIERLTGLLNTPELHDFAKAVVLEAAHQRERWASDHDAGKTAADWFWLIGYLAQKAMFADLSGDTEKALHHTISTAAALANWHAQIAGHSNAMRPGLSEETTGITPSGNGTTGGGDAG